MERKVFDRFSERSLRVVFLARMEAGRRGAAALEPAHLLDAVVREDQGELAARFPGGVTSSGPLQTARALVLFGGTRIADSVDA